MAQLRGKPLAQLGNGTDDCPPNLGNVPPMCKSCRQVDRWLERTTAWTTKTTSRFKNILKAILTGHDEILKVFCGTCVHQTVPSCTCFVQNYASLGLPLTVDTTPVDDPCLVYNQMVQLDTTCVVECLPDCVDCLRIIAPAPGIATCWWVDCADICAQCETVELDPCMNPVQLDMMTRAYNATLTATGKKATGETILAVLTDLFPGSLPQIISVSFGHVYVSLGRLLTDDERTYLAYLKRFIPLGLGVKLDFVSPCS